MVVEKLEEVAKALEACKADAVKVDKGNRSAATRLRKDVAAVAKMLKELRNAALEKVREVKAKED
jgi:hypothetical protein